jgi:hypothetical protein
VLGFDMPHPDGPYYNTGFLLKPQMALYGLVWPPKCFDLLLTWFPQLVSQPLVGVIRTAMPHVVNLPGGKSTLGNPPLDDRFASAAVGAYGFHAYQPFRCHGSPHSLINSFFVTSPHPCGNLKL